MALTKLKQIEGGLELRQDIADLKGLTSQINGHITTLYQRTLFIHQIIKENDFASSSIILLSETPNNNKVEVWINGVRYLEGKDFTVNREYKTLTWTNEEVKFDGADQNVFLDTDEVYAKYSPGGVIGSSTGIKILHQNELPKNIVDGVIYNQGDIIFKVNVTPGSNIGWVCTEGGELGTWNAFGEVVDEDNKTISTNASGDIVIG